MTVRPLHDRVLIKRIEEQETVKGGIIVPEALVNKVVFEAVMRSRPQTEFETSH